MEKAGTLNDLGAREIAPTADFTGKEQMGTVFLDEIKLPFLLFLVYFSLPPGGSPSCCFQLNLSKCFLLPTSEVSQTEKMRIVKEDTGFPENAGYFSVYYPELPPMDCHLGDS